MPSRLSRFGACVALALLFALFAASALATEPAFVNNVPPDVVLWKNSGMSNRTLGNGASEFAWKKAGMAAGYYFVVYVKGFTQESLDADPRGTDWQGYLQKEFSFITDSTQRALAQIGAHDVSLWFAAPSNKITIDYDTLIRQKLYDIMGIPYRMEEGKLVTRLSQDDPQLVRYLLSTSVFYTVPQRLPEEAVQVADVPGSIGVVTITYPGRINIRTGQGMDQKIVAQALHGQAFPCTAMADTGWYEIALSTEQRGYVRFDLASFSEKN